MNQGKFVDITNDIAFRKIFGNEKKTVIIISFLNAILKLEGENRIKSVSLVNPYKLPRIAGEKASIIDVRAIDNINRQFIIEMQIAERKGFDKRVQYYACREYSTQIQSGEKYSLLNPTYFIGILDFIFFSSPGYLSNHLILDQETLEHKLNDIRFTFVELPKFTKELNALETLYEKWIFFIKNASNLDYLPENINDEGLLEAYQDAEKHTWSIEELKAYDNASIAEQDERGRIQLAVEKAKEEGKEQGKEQEKKEMVIRCLKLDKSIEETSLLTGLDKEEILEIKAEWDK